jgi:methylated-DNA-[protein]-cysteine S-methyltransferase
MITQPGLRTLLYTTLESPIGELLLLSDGERLRGLHFQAGLRAVRVHDFWRRAEEPFAEARDQLGEYLAGERVEFDVPAAGDGTAFQRLVWAALAEIPYGETLSYGELAGRIGRPSASRAVGWPTAAIRSRSWSRAIA